MAFEMFVGIVQGAVFALLTLFFVKMAIAEPHGSEH
jgi:F0F1-type ATP synthase membrane subunit a